MKAEFKHSFEKDLAGVSDKRICNQIKAIIGAVEKSAQISEVCGTEQVSDSNYYKIGVGDYRLGLCEKEDGITFVRCLHRDEIRQYFLMKLSSDEACGTGTG